MAWCFGLSFSMIFSMSIWCIAYLHEHGYVWKWGMPQTCFREKWSNMKFEDKRCQTMNWWYSIYVYIYIYIIIYRYLRDTNDNYDTYEILWYIMIPFSDLSQSFPWDDPHVVTYDTDRRRVGSSSAASRPFGKPVTCALVGAGEKRMGDVLAPFLGQAILRVENIYHLVI